MHGGHKFITDLQSLMLLAEVVETPVFVPEVAKIAMIAFALQRADGSRAE